jgi:hypothetical protein
MLEEVNWAYRFELERMVQVDYWTDDAPEPTCGAQMTSNRLPPDS